ncbi:hypothetical protein BSPWISOXPB_880 [uncultured Gammaproteobacteria bacterium]|nr:hypothetical protein BSPWISOXPB_880 [uncultured Gammaproteobacteria bacterium]
MDMSSNDCANTALIKPAKENKIAVNKKVTKVIGIE